jgi:hypothetical protein
MQCTLQLFSIELSMQRTAAQRFVTDATRLGFAFTLCRADRF